MVERLESDLSSTLKNFGVWHIKLQVMPLAHTTCPADFWVNRPHKQVLIECKETDCRTNKKARFVFKRVTQMHSMILFEYCDSNNSYLLLMFRERMLNKSDIYMIPIKLFKWITSRYKNKSCTREQAKELFWQYKVGLDVDGNIDIFEYVK